MWRWKLGFFLHKTDLETLQFTWPASLLFPSATCVRLLLPAEGREEFDEEVGVDHVVVVEARSQVLPFSDRGRNIHLVIVLPDQEDGQITFRNRFYPGSTNNCLWEELKVWRYEKSAPRSKISVKFPSNDNVGIKRWSSWESWNAVVVSSEAVLPESSDTVSQPSSWGFWLRLLCLFNIFPPC